MEDKLKWFGTLHLNDILLAQGTAAVKKRLKHELYEKAVKILRTKTVEAVVTGNVLLDSEDPCRGIKVSLSWLCDELVYLCTSDFVSMTGRHL